MNWIKKHLGLVLFLSGILVGVSGMILFSKQNTVKVVVDNGAIIEAVQRNGDSLRKVWGHEKDSILKSVPKQETEVKIIYKTLEREKTIITFTRNIDSLRKSSIEYIKKI